MNEAIKLCFRAAGAGDGDKIRSLEELGLATKTVEEYWDGIIGGFWASRWDHRLQGIEFNRAITDDGDWEH